MRRPKGTSNKVPKKRGEGFIPVGTSSPPWRVLGIALLVLLSLFSIYEVGVKVGMRRYVHQSSLLLSQASQIIVSADDLPHHQRQSPSHIQESVLGIPQGEAQALPSVRVEQNKNDGRTIHNTQYGGAGDKQHLGGFTTYDRLGVSPKTWRYMMTNLGVKSLMDVGCGKGVSTLYFAEHGCEVLCLEGSHDGVQQTLLPDPENQIVEHDFSRGPYWPAKTYDAVWSVEFLEHVGRNYHYNYIQAFRKAALIFATHSTWGGWHHVEVHTDDYWVNRLEMFGFRYSERLTLQIRQVCLNEMHIAKESPQNPENIGIDGEYWNGQHIWLTMLVFINPAVASLPEHAHLLAEPGCYEGRDAKDQIIRRDCTGEKESKLPDSYSPLKLTQEQHKAWYTKVKARVDAPKQ